MNREDQHLCPSAKAKPGALLLGLVNGDQSVSFLPEPLPVTADFLEKAAEHGDLEKRFRFTHTCMKNGCGQWNHVKCGVIDGLANVNAHLSGHERALPNCAIRSACRWFSQDGGRACIICPFIVTDTAEQQEERVVFA